MHHTYKTKGVRSFMIEFDLEEGNIVKNVVFHGGCNGNLKATSKLVDGMTARKISEMLKCNTCGPKPTSCADQLAIAVIRAVERESEKA